MAPAGDATVRPDILTLPGKKVDGRSKEQLILESGTGEKATREAFPLSISILQAQYGLRPARGRIAQAEAGQGAAIFDARAVKRLLFNPTCCARSIRF